MPAGIGFHLAHAKRLRAIATAPQKTDQVDARLLGRMLLSGLILEAYPRAGDQRELLRLLRHRTTLVRYRTRLAGRMHSQLHQQRLALPREKLLRQATRAWLRRSGTTLMLTDLTTRLGGLRSSPQSLSERWPLMNPRLSLLTLPALLLAGAGTALAQGLPTSQPALIQIFREQVKLGRAADHARIEAGWPAAFAKAKSPNYYLAMTSLTGASEAWFIIPYASNAVAAAEMKLEESDTTLAAELQRLSRADAEVLTDAQSIQAVARPELSYGAYPNLARQRFWEISIFRVRPGHEADFDAAAKAYGASTGRTAPSSSYRVYEVTAGMPSPTYVVFASVESYGQFDEMMANGMKTMQNFTPEERTTLQKFSAEGLLNSETNRFQLNPVMSYVSSETRATDPTFWMPKRPARRP